MKSKVCACGQEFTPVHGNQKLCPTCREERYNARHPLKLCRKCGKETRDMGRIHNWCLACREEKSQADRVAGRTAQKAKQRPATSNDFLSSLDNLPDAELEIVLSVMREFCAKLYGAPPPTEEVNPEMVDHADQDAIDAAFGALMGDIDL